MQKELDGIGTECGHVLNEYSILCKKCRKTIIVPTDRTPEKRVKYFKSQWGHRIHNKVKGSHVCAIAGPSYTSERNSLSSWIVKTSSTTTDTRNIEADDFDSDVDTELSEMKSYMPYDKNDDNDTEIIGEVMDGDWSSCGEMSDTSIGDDSYIEANENELFDEYYKVFPISIDKADDMCIRFNDLLYSGTIKKTGILYKFLDDLTKHLDNGNHQYDEEVIQFFNTIGYLGGERTVNFLRGPMWHECGKGGVHNPENASMNFGGPSHITRLKHSSGYSTISSIIRHWLKSLLEYASSTNNCNSVIDNELVQVFPVALANDGTALKPSIQFDENQNHIVGLSHSLDHKFIKENAMPDVEYFKSSIVTEANVTYASILDNSVSLPVAVYSKPKSGKTGTELKEQFLSEVSLVQMCLNCLNGITLQGHVLKSTDKTPCTSICNSCLELNRVCPDCVDIGHTSIFSPLRACDNCIRDHSKCIKTSVLVYTADCEQGNKSAFEMIISERESNRLHSQFIFSVLPDAVHVGKSLKASFANWHILLDNDRSSLPMIRTLRDASTDLQRQLPRDSVINKDRMDVDCIMHLTKREVVSEIEKQLTIVHTIVPEKYRLCESNKRGLYKHPVDITVSDNGKIFALDYDESNSESRLIGLRLHVPVEVTVHILYPDARCLITLKDLVYICQHNKCISMFPEESVRVKQQKMTKVSILNDAGKNTSGSAEQLRKELETHLNAMKNMYDRQNISTSEVLLKPTVVPSTIAKESSDSMLAASDISKTIYNVKIRSNGLLMEGTSRIITPYPSPSQQALSICKVENTIFTTFESHPELLSGIYMFAENNGSFTKVIDANTGHLAPYLNGFVFTDEHEVKLYDKGSSAIRTVAECRQGGNLDGPGNQARFMQLMGISTDKSNSVFVTDPQSGTIKIISKVNGIVSFLKVLGKLYSAFGVHRKGHPRRNKPISEAVDLVEDVSSYLNVHVENAMSYLNTTKTMNGPEGTVSAKTVKSVDMISSELKNFRSVLQTITVNYPLEMSTLLTVAVENLHAVSHFKDDTQTMLQYAIKYYPIPDSTMNMIDLPRFPRGAGNCTVALSVEQKDEMREWANKHGKCVRQKSVRQETTEFKAGTLPLNLYVTSDSRSSAVTKPKVVIEKMDDFEEEQVSEYDSDDSDDQIITEEIPSVVRTGTIRNTYDSDTLTFLRGFRSRSGRCVRIASKFS